VHFAPDDGHYRQVIGEAAILYTAPMISSARTLLLPVLLFSLAGCGLKGPLYLPDEQPQEVPANAPVNPPPGVTQGSKVRTPLPPAPQSQKKDRERERTNPQSLPTPGAPTQSAPPPVSPPDPDRPATSPPPPGQ
jgi:predicted small lipoprotein YifL